MLIPFYFNGSSNIDTELQRFSMTHIIENGNSLIISGLFVMIFSAIIYLFSRNYYLRAVNSDFVTLADLPQDYVVYVTNLPQNHPPEELNHKLLN